MRNLEKFWCNYNLEEVAGDCGRYFPGGKEACLEQAERILKNSFVFQEHWEMERTHEAVVFGDKIEWDAVPFGDPEWLYALNRHTCFLILGKAWRYRCGEKDEAGRSKALEYGKKFVALLEDWLENAPLAPVSIKMRVSPFSMSMERPCSLDISSVHPAPRSFSIKIVTFPWLFMPLSPFQKAIMQRRWSVP